MSFLCEVADSIANVLITTDQCDKELLPVVKRSKWKFRAAVLQRNAAHLLPIHRAEQVLGHVLIIERFRKRRIGEDERILFFFARMILGK